MSETVENSGSVAASFVVAQSSVVAPQSSDLSPVAILPPAFIPASLVSFADAHYLTPIPPSPLMKEGDMVRYVLPTGHANAGKNRIAMVLRGFPDSALTLLVILDPLADPVRGYSPVEHEDGGGVDAQYRVWHWVEYSADTTVPGTWHTL